MGCDSTSEELADRGHRPRCRSPYADEPPRPAEWRAAKKREKAAKLREQAAALEAEAIALEGVKFSEGDDVDRTTTVE